MRKPRLLFRLSGEFLFRFAERRFPLPTEFIQLPPRFTRFEAPDRSPCCLIVPGGGNSNCEPIRCV